MMMPDTDPTRLAPAVGAQRRAAYRAQVGSTSDLSIAVWRIPETASLDRAPSGLHLIAERAKDISETGACLILRTGGPKPIELKAGERVRVQLKYAKFECLMEGRVRVHPGAPLNPDGSAGRAGVQFRADKNSRVGRLHLAVLGKIIASVRREEIRSRRLGLS